MVLAPRGQLPPQPGQPVEMARRMRRIRHPVPAARPRATTGPPGSSDSEGARVSRRRARATDVDRAAEPRRRPTGRAEVSVTRGGRAAPCEAGHGAGARRACTCAAPAGAGPLLRGWRRAGRWCGAGSGTAAAWQGPMPCRVPTGGGHSGGGGRDGVGRLSRVHAKAQLHPRRPHHGHQGRQVGRTRSSSDRATGVPSTGAGSCDVGSIPPAAILSSVFRPAGPTVPNTV